MTSLFGNLKSIVEYLDDNQRHDVDQKIESLRKNWIDLKDFILSRIPVIEPYINFHDIAEKLQESFKNLENKIRTSSNKETEAVDSAWDRVRKEYDQLKNAAINFNDQVQKVRFPYVKNNNKKHNQIQTLFY